MRKKQADPARTVTIAGISVALSRKSIRHAYLRVKRTAGLVTLSVPRTMPEAAIERFVREKADWIFHQLQKPVPPTHTAERSFLNGNAVTLWGRAYPLNCYSGARYAITLTGDTARMTAPSSSTPKRREAFARAWCREQLTAEIARVLPAWEAATGLKAAAIRTKDMKTRWGSCNVQTKTLWFNLQLVKLPPRCLDYVVLHELLHLAERGHGQRFYALLSRYMPDWKQQKAVLNGRESRAEVSCGS
ncbi:MAG: M48 family metallopeptidase [Firmicutes bacterium]|nr:M48 family metallopeptidase [Bacillota bacterium]